MGDTAESGGIMPGNLIVINGSEGLTWYVGDSKMDELMEFLHKVGVQQQPEAPEPGKQPHVEP